MRTLKIYTAILVVVVLLMVTILWYIGFAREQHYHVTCWSDGSVIFDEDVKRVGLGLYTHEGGDPVVQFPNNCRFDLIER